MTCKWVHEGLVYQTFAIRILRIGFSKLINQFEPIKIHNNPLGVVKSAKILGLNSF